MDLNVWPRVPCNVTDTHTKKKVYYAGNKMEERSYALVAYDSPHSEVDIY